MRTFSRKVATLWLVALCVLGGHAMAAGEVTVTAVSGTVLSTVGSKPIPALVYLNGKSVFADKTTGAFTLAGNPLVSPLSVGQTLSLRVLATGYAPIVKVLTVTSAQLTSGKFSGLKIAMKPVVTGKPLTVAATYKAAAEKGFFVVSGTVKSGTIPVCAVVWANGSAMLSCQKDAVGKFSLKGKLSTTGKVALKVFPVSTTYRTYSYTTPDADKDGAADFMDRDDDDDGVEDVNDACPMDPNLDCKPALTPTLTQLQTSIFTPSCSICHTGTPSGSASGLPGSQNLSAGNTFATLVGVTSSERPALKRVAPRDAANSYIIQKLEGTQGIIGARMPPGGPYLDQVTIDRIKSWINAGALNN